MLTPLDEIKYMKGFIVFLSGTESDFIRGKILVSYFLALE